MEVDENSALYAEAHIPGAIGFDWKTDLQDQVKRDFLDRPPSTSSSARAGSPTTTPSCSTATSNNWFAAYTLLVPSSTTATTPSIKSPNGPRRKWIAEGRPTTTRYRGTRPRRSPPRRATTRSAPTATRSSALDTAPRSSTSAPQEFSGSSSHARLRQEGAQRAGHIPGRRCVPWGQAVRGDGTSSRPTSWRRSTRARASPTATIRSSPTAGSASAPRTRFVLHELLGRDNVKNYDGSWTEWGNLVNVPIERAPARSEAGLPRAARRSPRLHPSTARRGRSLMRARVTAGALERVQVARAVGDGRAH